MAESAEVFQFPVEAFKAKGFTKTPNTLLEKMMQTNLSALETRVLMAVIGRTLRFHKNIAWVSGKLISDDTKLHKARVSEGVNKLIARNILIKEGKNIGVNCDVEAWLEKPTHSRQPARRKAVKAEKTVTESYVNTEQKLRKHVTESYVNTEQKLRKHGNIKEVTNNSLKKTTKNKTAAEAQQVIAHLNAVANRSFKGAAADVKRINARLAEGFTVNELKQIIDWKTADWRHDPSQSKYLRPETLFGSKADSYLNEANQFLVNLCPHQEIINVWEKVFPDRAVSEWDGSREGYLNLQMRWNEGFSILNREGHLIYTDKDSGIIWWKRMFEYIANKTNLPEKSFLSLSWVVQHKRFLEIKEGKYHA